MKKTRVLHAGVLMAMFLAAGAAPGHSETPSPSSRRFNPPAGWHEQGKFDLGYAWSEQNDRKTFISVLEDENAKDHEILKDDRAFIEKIRKAKAFPQMLAGITDWKITRLERAPLPQGRGTRIILIGSYRNLHNRLVRFEEWQFFLNKGYGQIQYSEEAAEKARSHQEITKLLERYHPLGT